MVAAADKLAVGDRPRSAPGLGTGQMGSALMGVTDNFMFFDRGTYWVLPLTYLLLPKCTDFNTELARAHRYGVRVRSHTRAHRGRYKTQGAGQGMQYGVSIMKSATEPLMQHLHIH